MLLHTYKFKHPITKAWLEIKAANFTEALRKLREVN